MWPSPLTRGSQTLGSYTVFGVDLAHLMWRLTPRSPYDDLLGDVAQGQPMRVESTEPKDLRGAKVSINRLAKRRGVPITYQALTNGFAVLRDEAMSKSKTAPGRRQWTRQAADEKASGT